jgi:hypothetical protein
MDIYLIPQLMKLSRNELEREYMGSAEFEHGGYPKALKVLSRKTTQHGIYTVPAGTVIDEDGWEPRVTTNRPLEIWWLAPTRISMKSWDDNIQVDVASKMPSILDGMISRPRQIRSKESLRLRYVFDMSRRANRDVSVGWVNLSPDWHDKAETGCIFAAFVVDPTNEADPGRIAFALFQDRLKKG